MENTVKISLENLKGMSHMDRCHLANGFETSSYELDMLVDLLDEKEDSDNFLKNAIVSHRNTSAETLDKLTDKIMESTKIDDFQEKELLLKVAQNENTSSVTLDKIANLKDRKKNDTRF